MKYNNENRSYIYKIKLNKSQPNDARVIASDFISKGSKVLDVGCACGDFGVFLSDEKKCNIYGMEYDKNSIVEAQKTNVFQKIHQVDLNYFQSDLYPEYYKNFDCVTLIDVLEHTVNPENSFLKLKSYIKDDGFFIISLPNASFGNIKVGLLQDDFTYTNMGILDKTHLRFFTYKTIANFFTNINFEITECKAKVSNVSNISKDIPHSIKKYIRSNPHSFIYQYIFKVKESFLSEDLLKLNNYDKMNLKWKDVRKELKTVKINNTINYFLPVGSIQRRIIKSVYNKFVKGG